MRFKLILTYALVIGGLVTFPSCLKKYDLDRLASDSWDPNLAVPLAYSSFTVYDILAETEDDDLVIIDPESGLLALMYEGRAYSFGAAEILALPDVSFSESLSAGSDLEVPVIPSFVLSHSAEESYTYSYDFEGASIEDLLLQSGTLTLSLSTTLQHDLSIDLTLPYTTLSGTPLTATLDLPYSGGGSSNGSIDIDLSGYLFDFTAGGMAENSIEVTFNFSVSGTGNPVNGNESVDVSLALNNLAFERVSGDFGQRTVGIDGDSILIRIFNNMEDGYFELVDPKLRLNIVNSFGFPVEIDLTNLESIDANTGEVFPLTGYPNPIDVNYPTLLGDSAQTELLFDNSNTSNITSIITPAPKYLGFDFEASSNPDGAPLVPNFMTSESELRVDATLEMGLEGFAYGFQFRDTVEFSFDESVEEVEWVKIRINTNNGFPVDISPQVYLVDANYALIDSLLPPEELVLQSGLVDASGRVTTPTQKITDILFSKERVPNLLDAAHLIIVARGNTRNGTQEEIVRIYDDYSIDLRLGMQVQGSVTF